MLLQALRGHQHYGLQRAKIARVYSAAVVTCNAGLDARIIHQVGALLTSPYGHTAVQSSDFGFGICCGVLQMPQERVQIWMRHLHTSSQSRVKTFNSSVMDRHMQHSVFHTRPIAFLAFSCPAFSTPATWCRIFMSRKFVSRIFNVPW